MRAEQHLEASFRIVLKEMDLSWPDKAVIEPSKDAKYGDLASNLALVLAKVAGVPPRELAGRMGEALTRVDTSLAAVEVAGPGFLNVTFKPDFWRETVLRVTKDGERFGSTSIGQGSRMQIEYVSANPTGPLHIGHGRGAAVGDSITRLLRFAGYDVTTEYYINDAGRQMRLLGLSIWLRAKELAGLPVTWPEDYYHGSYIIDIAREMMDQDKNLTTLSDKEGEDRCFTYGMQTILEGIKKDLAAFRVEHQIWFSERSLVERGAVEDTFARLKAAGLSFEKDGALWFRTTDFGDDKDRVLQKSDGSLTYFASDIAYHDDKYLRGFDRVVDIWGADHHGYVPRMRAAVQALGRKREDLDVVLIQLVNLLENGVQIAMSTRAGQFETLADVVAEVGVDAARFMFLSRKSDSHLDFDLELVKQRTMDNPVYYVQYAHARVRSVLRKAAEAGYVLPEELNLAGLASLTAQEELNLLHFLDRFEDVARDAAQSLAPHHISHYLMELAGMLHSYYARNPVLQAGEPALVLARLALLRAVGQVVKNGLALLGVNAPESM
ncbi:MAG: arginine--tRNA ligase [Bilophila sp.]